MRIITTIISLAIVANLSAQTSVECLRDYYLSGITSPANLNNTRFTGIKLTVSGATSSTYLTYPVTATVSGNFVKMRGNNAYSANVDYTNTSPSFASANALLTFTQGCVPTSSGSVSDNWGTQVVLHDNTLVGQGIAGNELGINNSVIPSFTDVTALIVYNHTVIQSTFRPNVTPTGTYARLWHDITAKILYKYHDGAWYAQGTISSASAPPISETVSSINFEYKEAEWYNTTNQQYYKVVGAAWQTIAVIDMTNIVYRTGNQTIAGEKTMTDTLRATKGIVSNTVKSTGGETTAANETLGVQKNGVVNTYLPLTLDGTYNSVVVNTNASEVTITLPTATLANIGWTYKISKFGVNVAKIVRPDQSTIVLYSTGLTLNIKNNSTTWEIE